ncbi:MFS transporter [Mariniluteicoccus endophyticus]
MTDADRPAVPTWVFGSLGFVTFFDRFGMPPMLLIMARQTGIPLQLVIQLVTIYSLLYALGQPAWGVVSDRLGRGTVLRLALFGAAVGSLLSALVSGFVPLLLARGLAGLTMGALYPALLTIIGDTYTGPQKVRALSDLQAYAAVGNAVTTLVTGAVAAWTSWRVPFAITAVACLAMLVVVRDLRTSTPDPTERSLREAAGRWPALVYVAAFTEGAVLMGILTYVVPALQADGVGVALAGALGATYGLGVIAGTRLMRPLSRRTSRTQRIAVGGAALVAAWGLAALMHPVTLTAAAVLTGVANAVMHSSLQGWATEVAPRARATAVSLFVTALFLGASAGTFLMAPWAGQGRYALLFAVATAATGAVVAYVALAHRAWARTHR